MTHFSSLHFLFLWAFCCNCGWQQSQQFSFHTHNWKWNYATTLIFVLFLHLMIIFRIFMKIFSQPLNATEKVDLIDNGKFLFWFHGLLTSMFLLRDEWTSSKKTEYFLRKWIATSRRPEINKKPGKIFTRISLSKTQHLFSKKI